MKLTLLGLIATLSFSLQTQASSKLESMNLPEAPLIEENYGEPLLQIDAVDPTPDADIPSDEEVLRMQQEIKELFPETNTVQTQQERMSILARYSYVDTRRVPQDLYETAIAYYDAHKSSLRNPNYLTLVDFGARSNLPRMFIIDMNTGRVASIHVAHGEYSDPNKDGHLDSFSNRIGSKQSSEGFYRVSETYNSSKFGYAARLDGLSSSNSNARARAVVLHGSKYVWERSDVLPGYSWGCLAIAENLKAEVVPLLANGSLLYASISR
ncbi:MAG: murein L,D-transpeptidase catalytic domain family protein [Bdellovibrionales bacterium]|nr:murein L,D-transpeptidase catalytic domain family protein [Bdellovibrionales bacterium]